VFAQSVDVAPVKGKVVLTLPGQSPAPLAGPRRMPVGSTVAAPSATVRVTAADGKGGTYSGRFSDGSFQVVQSTTGGGATEIKLVGRCVQSTAVSDTPTATTARPRHKAPVIRQLQVVANGEFEVVGNDASAHSVPGGTAQYSMTNACDGTQITAQTGRVQAQSQSTGAYTLKPNQSLTDDCEPKGPAAQRCLLLLARPQSQAFSFGLLLVRGAATSFQVCYVTPQHHRLCFTGPIGPPDATAGAEAGGLTCRVNDGRGQYAVRWLVNGHQVGVTHHFMGTQPHDPVLGNDKCTGYTINVNQ
jgi:hypothetical protein